MLVGRIRRRAYCCIGMIAHFNGNMFLFSSVFRESGNLQNPSFVPLSIRCSRGSSTAHNHQASVQDSIQSSMSIPTNRISRVARTDAQRALFDYLHCTRGFDFTDAEHISKNSPHFLQDLLANVENEQDVSRALSKFLRYHPINEFEPFLESLGLTPSELRSLLPRNLMFLNDDHVMLDNFHALCDYGIPRTKIGKIYKDVNEIFKYEHRMLVSKVGAFEELGLSRPTIIKLLTCCPALLVGDIKNDFVKVLEKLKGLGFGNDWIGSYLSDKITYKWNRMLETMIFLGEVGYSEMQMRLLLKRNPSLLLFEGSGKRIYTLVGGLLKLGLKMNELYSLFLANPQILSPKCAKNLWKALYLLFEIGMDTDDIANIASNHILLLCSHSLKGPKTLIRSYNGDISRLRQTIKEDPLKLITLASKSNVKSNEQVASKNPDKALEKIAFLLRLGYVENSDEIMKALKRFRGRADLLQERFDCLVEAGLDCNIVSSMVRQAPQVLNQSKDLLRKKIDCLRNILGYPLESIAGFPAYLCYDMARVNLRFSMYVWLRKREVVKAMLSLTTLIAYSDARFVKYFVDVHPEGPAKWEDLKKSLPLG